MLVLRWKGHKVKDAPLFCRDDLERTHTHTHERQCSTRVFLLSGALSDLFAGARVIESEHTRSRFGVSAPLIKPHQLSSGGA